MKQDEFLMWLFEKFNMPESRYMDLTRIYGKALPENSDFEYLKNIVIKEWETPTTLPTTKWLRYQLVERNKAQKQKNHIPARFGTTCEAVKQQMESREAFLSNYQECQNAMRECMAHYEHITGRKIRRSSLCS